MFFGFLQGANPFVQKNHKHRNALPSEFTRSASPSAMLGAASCGPEEQELELYELCFRNGMGVSKVTCNSR